MKTLTDIDHSAFNYLRLIQAKALAENTHNSSLENALGNGIQTTIERDTHYERLLSLIPEAQILQPNDEYSYGHAYTQRLQSTDRLPGIFAGIRTSAHFIYNVILFQNKLPTLRHRERLSWLAIGLIACLDIRILNIVSIGDYLDDMLQPSRPRTYSWLAELSRRANTYQHYCFIFFRTRRTDATIGIISDLTSATPIELPQTPYKAPTINQFTAFLDALLTLKETDPECYKAIRLMMSASTRRNTASAARHGWLNTIASASVAHAHTTDDFTTKNKRSAIATILPGDQAEFQSWRKNKNDTHIISGDRKTRNATTERAKVFIEKHFGALDPKPCHYLRRIYATCLTRHRNSLTDAQSSLGHASVRTTCNSYILRDFNDAIYHLWAGFAARSRQTTANATDKPETPPPAPTKPTQP